MGVYIPDMEMPKNCLYCYFFAYGCCELANEYVENATKRRDDCPLIEAVEWHNCIVDKEAE